MTIVLCSKGYPGSYTKGKILKNINKIKVTKPDFIFHAGTRIEKYKILSDGGRVLNITSTGRTFYGIRKRIIKLIKELNWKQGFYRKDIGWRVINKDAHN